MTEDKKIVGYKIVDFTGKNGVKVEGVTMFLASPIEVNRGAGIAVEKVFLNSEKLKELSFTPRVDEVISLAYNRFGKVINVTVLDNDLEVD